MACRGAIYTTCWLILVLCSVVVGILQTWGQVLLTHVAFDSAITCSSSPINGTEIVSYMNSTEIGIVRTAVVTLWLATFVSWIGGLIYMFACFRKLWDVCHARMRGASGAQIARGGVGAESISTRTTAYTARV